MENSKRTTWVAGTVLLAVAILALAWFVFIAPVVDETSTVASDTQVAEDRNAGLRDQLDTLKAEFANLQTARDELAVIEGQIPKTPNTSEFVRTIDALKAAAGTNVIDVQFGTPEDVIPAGVAEDGAVAAPAEEPATEDPEAAPAADDAAAADSGAAPVGADIPVIPGFVAVPVSVTALGNPVGVLTFLDGLQQQSARLILVTGLQGTGQKQEDATGGRPATNEGDLELVISGYIYVLEDMFTPTAPPTDDGTAPETPALPEGAPNLSGT
jgi:hypothetical protein